MNTIVAVVAAITGHLTSESGKGKLTFLLGMAALDFCTIILAAQFL